MLAFVPMRISRTVRVTRIPVYLPRLRIKNFFASWSWAVVDLQGKVILHLLSYYLPSHTL